LAFDCDEARIDAVFAPLKGCHLPGAAVGVAIDGKPAYRKAFGLANMELPIALSTTMRMRIGSTTKHFVCLAYLLLCEAGLADLDDPVGKYVPEVHGVIRDVTIRQLMGHTSGIRDAVELSWLFSGTGHPVSSQDLLSLYRNLGTVNFPPGTAFSYNNGGYVLLTFAIERIANRPLEEVLEKRIFHPIGMFDTRLRRFDTDFLPNSATLHTRNRAGDFEKAYLGTALSGEGGMVSTVDDMLRWLAHMDHPFVGSASTWEALKTPQRLVNGTSTGYGLGLITEHYRNVTTLSHAGGVLGGNSQMLKVPAAGLDIVVMVNRHDVLGMFLVNDLLERCLAGLDPPQAERNVAIVTGTFRSPATDRVVQLHGRQGQQYACIDGFDVPVRSGADAVLHPAAGYGMLQQHIHLVGNREHPEALRLQEFGNWDELVAVSTEARTSTDRIRSRYRSDAASVDALVSGPDAELQMTTVGPFGSARFTLEPLAENVWRARSTDPMSWGALLAFDQVSGSFKLNTTRTRGLQFRRCG